MLTCQEIIAGRHTGATLWPARRCCHGAAPGGQMCVGLRPLPVPTELAGWRAAGEAGAEHGSLAN